MTWPNHFLFFLRHWHRILRPTGSIRINHTGTAKNKNDSQRRHESFAEGCAYSPCNPPPQDKIHQQRSWLFTGSVQANQKGCTRPLVLRAVWRGLVCWHMDVFIAGNVPWALLSPWTTGYKKPCPSSNDEKTGPNAAHPISKSDRKADAFRSSVVTAARSLIWVRYDPIGRPTNDQKRQT